MPAGPFAGCAPPHDTSTRAGAGPVLPVGERHSLCAVRSISTGNRQVFQTGACGGGAGAGSARRGRVNPSLELFRRILAADAPAAGPGTRSAGCGRCRFGRFGVDSGQAQFHGVLPARCLRWGSGCRVRSPGSPRVRPWRLRVAIPGSHTPETGPGIRSVRCGKGDRAGSIGGSIGDRHRLIMSLRPVGEVPSAGERLPGPPAGDA